MGAIGKYLIGIASAAFICSIFKQISEKMGISGKIINMLAGIFMLISFISPVANITFPDITNLTSKLEADAQSYVNQGQEIANKQLRSYISEQVTSYILEKASTLNANVEVSVALKDGQLPEPVGVQIGGSISPYAKNILSSYISEELGIPEEKQIWTSQH